MILLNDLKRQHQDLEDEIRAAVVNVCGSGWYVLGEQVRAVETDFATYCGVGHCIGLNSGTDALEIALRGLGLGTGNAVATVANAGGYASTAIRCVGATPYYIDVDPETYNMDLDKLQPVIDHVQAVVVTHLYGRLAPMDKLLALVRSAGVPVIEDAAHAHGASRDGQKVGAWGDLACFSFYPTKNLGAVGDGGAIVTANKALADRCRCLAQYGWSERNRAAVPGGRNSRLDEIQAAVLRVKLPRLDQWNKRRRQVAALYESGLENIPALSFRPRGGTEDTVHLFVIECADRTAVQISLKEAGIGSAVHYPVADHQQPAYQVVQHSVPLPVTEALCGRVLSLPCYPEIHTDEVASVVAALQKQPSYD